MFVSVEKLKASDQRYTSQEVPVIKKKTTKHKRAVQAEVDKTIQDNVTQGNIIGAEENLKKRKALLAVSSKEPLEFAYERAIGKNDSVYSNFIELLAAAKQKIGRVVVKEGVRNLGFATGFMVTDTLMMTNWHVFNQKEDVKNSTIEFNYELDRTGNPTTPQIFQLDPDTFFYSFEALDYCLVAVSPLDITGQHALQAIGYIYLDPSIGKLGDEQVELLNIIHHPDGDYKQLSIRQNEFVKILPTSLWYKSDTAQGSSGSPVFNDQWQVVAIHHMGVAATNEHGEYIDKDGVVIPVINGQIDEARVHWKANEGIRMSVIKKHVFTQFPDHPLVRKLEIPYRPTTNQELPEYNGGTDNYTGQLNADNITISFPSSLLNTQKNVHIDIGSNTSSHAGGTLLSPQEHPIPIATETKYEDNFDYSLCTGYDPLFLGETFRVELPQPIDEIRAYMAKVDGTDQIQLDYYTFSVIHHGLRRLPLLSAINIDGDEALRKDVTKRRDRWIRDHRLDYTVQLDDDFYTKSGFDRGHMSRREDANYGATPEEAKRNADLTCVFTNACPQVPKLNRSSYSGLWGKLEKAVLEKGAVKEDGSTGRISVFSGPIFKSDDPIFRAVQVPVNYYKVIVWLSDNQQLNVTAFMLSQATLFGDINFEALDLDKNIAFKEYQVSLPELQRLTQIEFSPLFEFDTFENSQPEQPTHIEIKGLRKVEKHIATSGLRAMERMKARKN